MVRLLSIRSGCLDLGSQSISLVNSKITSEAGKDGGNIFIDLQLVTLNHSRITVNAILGNGGNIRLAADFLITSADSSITASSEFGLNGQISVLPQALKALEQALTVAEPLRDERAKSYALGYLAQVYEADGRHEEALRLTRKAVFSAQQANAPDAVLPVGMAIGAMAGGPGRNGGSPGGVSARRCDFAGHSLRPGPRAWESNGRWFFPGNQRASILNSLTSLRRADVEPDPVKVQDYLVEARNTIEVLRSAEMEDYFQDECVASVRRKSATIESFAAHVAVICVVPLADRVELLVNFSSGLKRYKVAVGEAELTKTAIDLRRLLEKRTTSEFLRPAQQLYRWLITPLLAELKAQQTDTLVFIPDGALRNIPMAVLHDGEAFLVSQYAVAVSPGLTLTDPAAAAAEKFAAAQRLVQGRARFFGPGFCSVGSSDTPNQLPDQAAVRRPVQAGQYREGIRSHRLLHGPYCLARPIRPRSQEIVSAGLRSETDSGRFGEVDPSAAVSRSAGRTSDAERLPDRGGR